MTEQKMIRFTLDGQEITVPKGTTVYQAAQQLGIEIPIFCYQDRMPPFGACRVCLVEVEKMPKPQASCTLEAMEGMVVKTQSAMSVDGRRRILEFLLINHPLDCPICDRGGECPLQENALKFGPGRSQFHEEKRHFVKPKPLGPVLMLDRERCIVCARCTRFGDLIAGDHALEFLERGYKTEVGTPDGGPANSKYIGNTIMICPVGALTSDVYRFRARPWDNDSTQSTCTLCPVGCSLILDARDGEIMRTRSQENRDVNDIWLCDKGWFGYEFSSHPDRLKSPLIRRNGTLQPASWDEALDLVVKKIQESKSGGRLAAWGGNTLTVEENVFLQQLVRKGCGVDHVDHRIGMPFHSAEEEGIPPGMEISIGDCEQLSFAVLCGLDLTEEFPVIWLRLKQAINRGATVLFIGHYAPEIAPHLDRTILHAPGKEIESLKELWPQIKSSFEGRRGALFVGRQYLDSPHRRAILSELMQWHPQSLNILEGKGNSMGARWAGMHPESTSTKGLSALEVLKTAAEEGWNFLYVVGADPAEKMPAQLWQRARERLGFLVVQDLFLNATAQQADVVLPTLSFVEKEGSFINIEGRVQKIAPGKAIPEGIYSDREIFQRLAQALEVELMPAPLNGERLPLVRPSFANPSAKTRNEETLSATFAPALFDHGVRMRHNPHVIQLAKEPRARLHPNEGAKYGIQTGDTVRIHAHGQAVTLKAKLDTRVAPGTVVIPLGFEQVRVCDLEPRLWNGFAVKLERVT